VTGSSRGAAVELRGVSKRFRTSGGALPWRRSRSEKVALHSTDLCVEYGSVTGIIGMNGSGKSTLVRILATLMLPDTGWARVFGHDVVNEAAAVRRHVNRVSVEASFFKSLSPWENLLYSARLYGSDDDIRSRSSAVLRRLGLPESTFDKPMRQLSRGQQQKVAIARSLLTAPSLLLMDEPTTGLDPRSKREVQGFIRAMRREREVTVLLCTHDLAEAEVLCDRVVVLDGGRVLADATPEGLRTAARTATLEDAFLQIVGRSIDDDVDTPEES